MYTYLPIYLFACLSLYLSTMSLRKRQRGIWLLQIKSTLKEDIVHYLLFLSSSFYAELHIFKGTEILLIRIFHNRSPSDVKWTVGGEKKKKKEYKLLLLKCLLIVHKLSTLPRRFLINRAPRQLKNTDKC